MRVIQISIERRGLIISDRNRTNESRSICNIITPAKDVNCPAILLLAARRQGSASLLGLHLDCARSHRRVSINSRRRFFVLPNQNGTHCGDGIRWSVHAASPRESASEYLHDLRFHLFQFVVGHRAAYCAFDEVIEEKLSSASVALR